ncbi:hypothetical protein NYQ10_00585 [Flavobacterium johnsoniae]|uniref:hypothetical protein n=1 Tax=Flavobacterium johnsoniae TaxID=986 RepID=UPI0025B16A14|nr:hypothetical protein [Flavobacterium johnsoniae]WJS94963.1 hypothetical protein NYQ10_00585 [Flavobacterium johnsoniae]
MIEKREKRKKIFYVPGMISLVLIPLFCVFYFYQSGAFKVYSYVDLSLPNKEDFENYKIGELRKYKAFYFNNQKSKEEQKLRELRLFARSLVKSFDTINGAKVYLGPKTDYDTFVGILNIINEEKVPTWALFEDNIYVIASAKPNPNTKRPFFCGTAEYSLRNSRLMEEENRKKELLIFQKAFLKQQWLIFLGYFGIVLISIFTLVKFNKNKKYNQK